MHVMVFQNVYSTVLCIKHLRGCCWDRLAPRHRHPGVSLGQMVSELLKVRLKNKIKSLRSTYLYRSTDQSLAYCTW